MNFIKLTKEHTQQLNPLTEEVIDEVYANESDKIKKQLKANFTGQALEELINDNKAVFYGAEINGKIVAFIFGWYFYEVFTIYWIYTSKENRGKGIANNLLGYVKSDLVKQGCYKIEMYSYASNEQFIKSALKLGFKEGIIIEKNMFGVRLQNIYMFVGDKKRIQREKRIKIIGEAGQGIKLLSYTLASILAKLGHEVSLNLEYDSAVRSGTIISDLIYSETRIENPIIDEADVLLKFTRTRQWFPAKNLIIDETICGKKCTQCAIKCYTHGDQYNFTDQAVTKFGSKLFINMIALGRVLKYIGINIMLINIEDVLPPKFIDKNIEAIKYGFSFRDAV